MKNEEEMIKIIIKYKNELDILDQKLKEFKNTENK